MRREPSVKKAAYLKPWIFGTAAGGLFVLADVIFTISPPSAYAFCMSCHVRDLVNTIVNLALRSHLPVTEVAGRTLLLTSPGVMLGAFAAARAHHEVRPRRADRRVRSALLGFLVMTIGIVIFGCPTRLVLRAGCGEVYGIVGTVGLLAGIAAATIFLKLYIRWKGNRR